MTTTKTTTTATATATTIMRVTVTVVLQYQQHQQQLLEVWGLVNLAGAESNDFFSNLERRWGPRIHGDRQNTLMWNYNLNNCYRVYLKENIIIIGTNKKPLKIKNKSKLNRGTRLNAI
jgi:hypothetical protein